MLKVVKEIEVKHKIPQTLVVDLVFIHIQELD